MVAATAPVHGCPGRRCPSGSCSRRRGRALRGRCRARGAGRPDTGGRRPRRRAHGLRRCRGAGLESWEGGGRGDHGTGRSRRRWRSRRGGRGHCRGRPDLRWPNSLIDSGFHPRCVRESEGAAAGALDPEVRDAGLVGRHLDRAAAGSTSDRHRPPPSALFDLSGAGCGAILYSWGRPRSLGLVWLPGPNALC